ncbi:MAG: FtsX-like permease family protein [Phycisphaerae bacterium]|jgi:hypothetical protein
MSKRYATVLAGLVLAGVVLGHLAAASRGAILEDAFTADLKALTANPHRLPGWEKGSLAAGEHVLKRLKQIGFTDSQIFLQRFPVIQCRTTECRLIADGKTYPLWAARPNVLQASVTPLEGITGETVYAGKGEMPDFGKNYPKDKIVVLDMQSNWHNAFAAGARAVLFVGDREGSPSAALAQLHFNVPSNLPRFYVPFETAEQLDLKNPNRKGEITLQAAAEWEELRGCNVIAVLPGTDPVYAKDSPAQAVVLAAPLDSFSEVPELSPGARDAGNVAALLQIAENFFKDRPRRDVIFCFLDGQSAAHAGARAFYGALYRRLKESKLADLTLDDRLEDLDLERRYFNQVISILNQKDLMSEETQSLKFYDEALRTLRDQARTLDNDSSGELSPRRLAQKEKEVELALVTTKLEAKDLPADQQAQLTAQSTRLTAQIEQLKKEVKYWYDQNLGWNQAQADLHYRSISEKSRPYFDKLVVLTRQICERRLKELDQAIAEAQVSKKLLEAIGPGQKRIVLHLTINLGDARERWTFIHGDDTSLLDTDNVGNYMPLFKTINEVARKLGAKVAGFENRALSQNYDNRLFAPGRFADSTSIARLFTVWNLSLMTVMDRLPRQGMPTDTVAALNVPAMQAQTQQVASCLRKLLDENSLNQASKTRSEAAYGEAQWSTANKKSTGPLVRLSGIGGAMRAQPTPDAFVAVLHGNSWSNHNVANVAPGFNDFLMAKTNIHGIFETGPYLKNFHKNSLVIASLFDRPTVDEGREGLSRGITRCISNSTPPFDGTDLNKAAVMMFDCRFMTLVGYGFDRGVLETIPMRALSTAQFPKDRSLRCEYGNIISVFAPIDAKGLKLFNKAGIVALNNEPTRDGYQGQGLPLDDVFAHAETPPMTAHDLCVLNEYRLQLLRAVRIHQESLEVLTGQVKDMKADAAARKTTSSADWYYGTMETAAAFARLVYIPLIAVMNDLVTAVVLLLLLAMPFAYALERLLIGTPHIYRQIGWFTLFFMLTFALLYAVNPAFKIASTPIIIFLAFAIILLSSMVIFIMVRKLQTEVRKMQGLATTVHSADVSRLSTMMAAVNMGISTMRHRPLRTFLTAATVVLLTFTILTFASFGSSWDIKKTFEGPTSGGPTHVFVRHPLWSPIGEDIFMTLRGHLSQDATVVPRIWVSPTAQQAKDAATNGNSLEKLLANGNCERILPMSAAIGLDPADLWDANGNIRNEQLADLFDPNDQLKLLATDGIILTEAVAKELKLEPSDIGTAKVLFGGNRFTYAGTIRDQLATYKTLDNSDMLPVDYEASAGDSVDAFSSAAANTSTSRLTETPDVQSAQFVAYNIDKVVIISPQQARLLGGTLRSISVYPSPDKLESVRDIAEVVARTSQLPTYVGDAGGVTRMIFTTLAQASGWKDLLVPVILGGLIIFATMLGSVSDREREIYTFSSLGLAPPHVASLFFAEAAMYAVIGGMGGYLLGQVVARLLNWLSLQFGWSVPPMNYSSTNAIVTILIVMGTVLISTIYPAMKASRSANPGIQRSWRIPTPKGNLYDLVFPFTVSTYDITGVVSFLKEHFENFSDTSLGVFATTKCHVFRQQSNDMLGFQATVALAPFDLGVNQEFALLSQPSDIEGIDEVRILIYRLSGAQGDWQRANRVFVNDLRKQLLIWRSLPHETMDTYRAKTLEAWNDLPQEQVDPQSMGGSA